MVEQWCHSQENYRKMSIPKRGKERFRFVAFQLHMVFPNEDDQRWLCFFLRYRWNKAWDQLEVGVWRHLFFTSHTSTERRELHCPTQRCPTPTSLQPLTPSQGIFLLPNWICVLFLSDLSAPPGTASSAPPSDKFASKTCCFGFSAGSLDYWPKATFFNQFSQEYSFDAISVSCLLFIS